MSQKKVSLRVISPTEVKLQQDVDMVIMRCITGDMGILPERENCLVLLDYGALTISDSQGERKMAVFGGFAEMKDNVLTIMTNGAQWPDEIDLSLVEENRKKAEQRLKGKIDDVEANSLRLMLKRCSAQLSTVNK